MVMPVLRNTSDALEDRLTVSHYISISVPGFLRELMYHGTPGNRICLREARFTLSLLQDTALRQVQFECMNDPYFPRFKVPWSSDLQNSSSDALASNSRSNWSDTRLTSSFCLIGSDLFNLKLCQAFLAPPVSLHLLESWFHLSLLMEHRTQSYTSDMLPP
jgi:hypothetical protein